MKKAVLCLGLMFVFGLINSLNAQTNFGVKSGISMSTLWGDGTDDLRPRITFTAGVFAEFVVTEKFAIQPELQYNLLGTRQKFVLSNGAPSSSSIIATQKQDYLAIPILAKFYITESIYANAGPQIAFLVNAQGKVDQNGTEVEVGIDDLISPLDFGIAVGFGYKFNDHLSVDLRAYYGFSNINDEDTETNFDLTDFDPVISSVEIPSQQNASIALTFGYQF